MKPLDPTSDQNPENAISSPGRNFVFLGIYSYAYFLQFEVTMNRLWVVRTKSCHRVADDLWRESFGSPEIYG